jgi:hypothetical protein
MHLCVYTSSCRCSRVTLLAAMHDEYKHHRCFACRRALLRELRGPRGQEGQAVSGGPDVCSICCEEMEGEGADPSEPLACSHVLHTHCINAWVRCVGPCAAAPS